MSSVTTTKEDFFKKYGISGKLETSETVEKRKNDFFQKYGIKDEERTGNARPYDASVRVVEGADPYNGVTDSSAALGMTERTSDARPYEEENKGAQGKSVLEQALAYHGETDDVPMMDLGPQTQTDDKRTWFQKGALENGVTVGNVAKATAASASDAGKNATAGGLTFFEKLIDTIATIAAENNRTAMMNTANDAVVFSALTGSEKDAEQTVQEYANMANDTVKQAEQFVAGDLIDEQAVATKLNKVLNPLVYFGVIDPEKDSVLGEKSDALAQSAGQLVATAALNKIGVPWWLTSGVSAFGGEVESGLRQGATLEEAGISGLVTAGAEILTEKLSGGIKFGGKTLDDVLTRELSKKISNRFIRGLAKFGLDATGEGLEEIFSDGISKFGRWLTYQDDKTLEEMFLSPEALDEALEAFIGGVVLGGGSSVIKSVSGNRGGENVTDSSATLGMTSGETDSSAATQGTNVESRRLTESDIDDYMSVGDRKHVRDTKQRIMDNGESPVLTKPEEIVNFIRNAFRRKIQKVIKGYGRVNNRLASAVKTATGGDVVIDDYYLELDADKIAHISDHVERDNDVRNIPLTEAQVEQLPSYIDTYDDLIDIIRRKDGSVRLLLGKKINGHSIIVETVSKGRKSLHPVTAYQIDSSDYMKYYKTRAIDRSSTSRPASTGTVDISRPTIAPANTTIASPQSVVNTNPVEGINISPNESVGAAPGWFDVNTRLQYEYGTIPEGEKAVRPDDLPKRDYTGKDVSYTARTVKGAKVTPDEFVDLLNKDTAEGGLSYVKITNDATVQKAMEHIAKEGWEAAKGAWQADVHAGKTGGDMAAVGALLLNNAAKAGDRTTWLDILHDYQLMGTNTAQGLQALRILKTLEPSDKLYMVKRSIKQMVEDMKLDTEITIDPELENEYDQAQTDEQRNEVLDKIQEDVARQLPTTFMEKITALRYVNMLGNLRTQARNIVGNLTMKGVRSFHNAVATGIEAAANKLSGGKVERTRSLAVSKEQMAAGRRDFDNVQSVILDSGKFHDENSATEFAKGVQDRKQIFKFKPLEGYRKITNWAMEQGDIIFAKEAYARALAGYLKAKGITETDYSKVDVDVMDDARLFAAKEAQEATFRDTNALSGWVSKIGRRKDTPGLAKLAAEGIMPFRKTPANVLVRAEEYSPLGVINSVVTSVKAMQKGSEVTANQVINSWAKTLTGTGLFGVGMLLQGLGLLSTGPDNDEDKEDFEELNGWQNYALTLPDGTNLTIDSLSPAAIPVLMGAELMKLMGDKDLSFKDVEEALTSIADPMVEMSMLQGINDTLENVRYADSNLGQFAVNAALGYLTQGLTNTLAGQIERSIEDSRQQTYVDKDSNVPDWLQRAIGKASAKTPGLDYNQIPYINAWGEEEKNPTGALDWAYNLLSPAYFDKGKDDALTRELNRLNEAQGDVNVYPSAPDKSLTIDKQIYNLSAEEYVELAKKQGQTQKRLVEDLIGSGDYARLSDADKAKAIRYAYDYARDSARGEVIQEHPGLTTKWMANLEGDIAAGIIRKVATGTTEKYTGLSVGDAAWVVELLGGLTAEEGKSNVRDIQRIEAIAGADSRLSSEEQQVAMKDTLSDSLYDKYLDVLGLKDNTGGNLNNDDFAASYRIYLDAEGEGKKARTIAQYQQELGISYSTAKKLYEIYYPPAK